MIYVILTTILVIILIYFISKYGDPEKRCLESDQLLAEERTLQR